jgi:cell wall assembly regulator SMI1
LSDPQVAARVPEQKVRESWLGEPPASEQQIAALEGRLGRVLPPSYRSFLAASNGFEQPSHFICRLYGTDEVDQFSVRNPEETKIWAEAYQNLHPNLASWLQISDIGDCALRCWTPTRFRVTESGRPIS